ncbi:family 16 glycoside hydrolase [Novipirellula aureliae]|nr:family 16 glycoside hydrolase [Novipirellula aureliae]
MFISIFLILSSCLLPPSVALEESFSASDVGKLPPEFIAMHTGDGPPGKWLVTSDGDNRVLTQRDDSQSKDRTHIAIVDHQKLRNVKLSVRIKLVGGEKEKSAGIVWRFKDKKNYLLARIDVKDKRVRLYRVINGNRIRIGGDDKTELQHDRWYTLRIEHIGDNIKVYLDDNIVAMQEDRHFRDFGGIGLWTKSDSVAFFDDLHLKAFDATH